MEMIDNTIIPTPENEMMLNLVLAISDEITRMQNNLRNMDNTVRGHKQLTRSLERMRNHLLAAGFEVVDMVGMHYHEGMRVVASFALDTSLPRGCQVISSVSKPQVNYQGKMIQVAQVIVSQNL